MIPNNFYFIWLTGSDGHPFTINEYYSILTNYIQNKPDNITLYTDDSKLSNNYWVERLRSDIPLNQFDVEVIEPEYLNQFVDRNGVYHKVPYTAHQSDILRLKLLYRYGGVYMDCDCIAINRLDYQFFTKNRVVWGRENCNEVAFCNNVIMAPPEHQFIKDCLNVYCEYDYQYAKPGTDKWAYYSVMKPVEIYNKYSNEDKCKINIRPYSNFQPLYLNYTDTLKLFFENHFDEVKDSYEIHSWNTRNYGIVRNFTEPYILKADTTYCKAIRVGLGLK